MRRKPILVIVAAAAALTGGAVVICRSSYFQEWWHPPVLALPADDEVTEMRASLRGFQGFIPTLSEFTVTPDRVPGVLKWLRPAKHVRYSSPLNSSDELGEVIIRTKSDTELRLRFYWTGHSPVVFTPNGEDQFCGGVLGDGSFFDGGFTLSAAIRDASPDWQNRKAP